jgi:hypothetical protein
MRKRNDVFQQFLLSHIAGARCLTVAENAKCTLPERLDAAAARAWRSEIEPACELMVLRRLLRVEHGAGGKRYAATERVRELLPQRSADPLLARAAPLIAAALMSACAGNPAGVRPYHDTIEALLLGRIEQFATGRGAAYQICTDDCPRPTPKRLALLEPAKGSPLNAQTDNAAPVPVRLPDSPGAALLKELRGLQQKVIEQAPKKAPEAQPSIDEAAASTFAGGAAPHGRNGESVSEPRLTNSSAAGGMPSPGHPSGEGVRPVNPEGTQSFVNVSLGPRAGAMATAQGLELVVSAPASTTPATDSDELSARDFLNTWASAWSARDAKSYAGMYAADFVAPEGLRPAAWLARRTAIMAQASSIDVSIEITSMHVSAEHATVKFWQRYRSPTFRSRVPKSAILVKRQGAWKIRGERVIPSV